MTTPVAPITFVNRRPPKIENPISTIEFADFRNVIDVMKELNKHKTVGFEDPTLPPGSGKPGFANSYYNPKPEVYDRIVSDQLKAVVKQRSRGNRRK